MKGLLSNDNRAELGNPVDIIESDRATTQVASIEYAFYSFFLNYVSKHDKVIDVAKSLQNSFNAAASKYRVNGSGDATIYYKIMTFLYFAIVIRDNDLGSSKKEKDKIAFDEVVDRFESCTSTLIKIGSQTPENYDHMIAAKYLETLPVLCEILDIEVPSKESLLVQFFTNQFSRKAFDASLHLLSLEDQIRDVNTSKKVQDAALRMFLQLTKVANAHLNSMPKSLILRQDDVAPLLEFNSADKVIDAVAKAALLISKVSAHLDNAPVIFLGRVTDLLARAYPLASTYLGNSGQRSFNVSFSGTPGVANRRSNVDAKSLEQRTRNFVDKERVEYFVAYLEKIGIGNLDSEKPILICDLVSSTGYGLRRFVDFLEFFFKEHLKKKIPEFVFLSLDHHFMSLNEKNTISLMHLRPINSKSGLESKCGLEAIFNPHPDDRSTIQVRRMLAIPLSVSKLVAELMDNDVFESLFANNISFSACSWNNNQDNALERGAEFSKSKLYNDVVTSMLNSSIRLICAQLYVRDLGVD